jgi:hypothetical protein
VPRASVCRDNCRDRCMHCSSRVSDAVRGS